MWWSILGGVLLTAATVVLVWFAWLCLFRRQFSPVQWILYGIDLALVHWMWRAELPPRFPLSAGQGAVIICNHRSSIDPLIIQAGIGSRLVHWMVAQIYARHSFIAWLLKQGEIIPVSRRGGGIGPTKEAIHLAEQGELVGMFPEGTVNTGDAFMLPVRPGAVFVALRAGVPILPCYIEGSPYHDTPWRPALMRARVKLRVGELIDLSEYYGRDDDADLVHRLTLQCVGQIALLAGREDFQPSLAGRDWKSWA